MEEETLAHSDLCKNFEALVEWTEAGEEECFVCGAENYWDGISKDNYPSDERY